MTNSGKSEQRKILGAITAPRAERLLENWANARTDAQVERFLLSYRSLIDIPTELKQWPAIRETVRDDERRLERENEFHIVRRIGEFLRKAWDTHEPFRFDWYLRHALVQYEHGSLTLVPDDPPEAVSAFAASIFHLREHRTIARRCANPKCSNMPFFISHKHAQQFCSSDCAKPTQRESKRRWWAAQQAKKARKHAAR